MTGDKSYRVDCKQAFDSARFLCVSAVPCQIFWSSIFASFEFVVNMCFRKLKSDLKSTNIEELRVQMETYYEETQRLQTVLSSVYNQVPGTRNIPETRCDL